MPAYDCGAVAQLGERCVRNAEVRGSNPLSSTNAFSAGKGGHTPALSFDRQAFALANAERSSELSSATAYVLSNSRISVIAFWDMAYYV